MADARTRPSSRACAGRSSRCSREFSSRCLDSVTLRTVSRPAAASGSIARCCWACTGSHGPGFDAAMLAVHRTRARALDAARRRRGARGLLVVGRRFRDAAYWGVTVERASLLDFAAKHVFERTRPHLWLSIAPESTFSFPSGHAMQTLAPVAAAVVLPWPTRWRVPALVARRRVRASASGCRACISACTTRATCSAGGSRRPRGSPERRC